MERVGEGVNRQRRQKAEHSQSVRSIKITHVLHLLKHAAGKLAAEARHRSQAPAALGGVAALESSRDRRAEG
jgi:hypothetical protein